MNIINLPEHLIINICKKLDKMDDFYAIYAMSHINKRVGKICDKYIYEHLYKRNPLTIDLYEYEIPVDMETHNIFTLHPDLNNLSGNIYINDFSTVNIIIKTQEICDILGYINNTHQIYDTIHIPTPVTLFNLLKSVNDYFIEFKKINHITENAYPYNQRNLLDIHSDMRLGIDSFVRKEKEHDYTLILYDMYEGIPDLGNNDSPNYLDDYDFKGN